MLKEYPRFKKNEIEEFYISLSKKEKAMIEDYLVYRRARGITTEEKVLDLRRYILQIRYIVQKELKEIDLKDLRSLLVVINNSHLSDYVKNGVKTDLKNFLKYLFTDWSSRFANLEDIKLISKPKRKREINHQKMFSKEDIEKMMKHETKMFWKAFLITQYEGGLRTKEVRFLKWKDITFDVDGDLSELNIFSTKTKENRVIFVKEATFYLKKLMEEQENLNKKGLYVFHSVKDINKPVDKHLVSVWFRDLVEKALGREAWSYLLRHTRATELYSLADEGKIGEKTANRFMGHSRDMGEVYRNMSPDKIKEMLKKQVYKFEDLPEEKKKELEKEIDELKKVSVTQQDEITKLKAEVKKFLRVSKKIDYLTVEIKKYRGLPSEKEI